MMIDFNRRFDDCDLAFAEYDDVRLADPPKAPPRKPDYRTSDLIALAWIVSLIGVGLLGYVAGVNR
jgi:hypothetical protein